MNALLLLHGWGFDSQVWQPLLPELNKYYEIYCIDLPGFGLTEPMSWEAFKSKLLSELPEKFAILGWSLGGLYASRLAIEAPERITYLINTASSPCFIQQLSWPGVADETLEQFHQQVQQDPQRTLEQFMKLQGITIPISCRQPTQIGLLAGLVTLREWDLREQLSRIICPVSYLMGRLDAIVPYKLIQTMQKTYPDFDYFLFPKAGHVPFLSHTELFLEKLTSLIPSSSKTPRKYKTSHLSITLPQ